MKNDLSKLQLIEAIKNGDDSIENVLVVKHDGTISLFPYGDSQNSLKIRVLKKEYSVISESAFKAHTGNVGIKASQDHEFIDTQYKILNDTWLKIK